MRRELEAYRAHLGAIGAAFLLAALVACGGDRQAPAADTGAAPADPAGTPAAGAGAQLYQRCSTCHQPNGQGLPGTFPPLAGSEYATASNPAVPIRIVLRGMQGPLTVHGETYDGIMPPYGTGIAMSDDEVAAVLTYVRQSFGNNASAITAAEVAKERAAATSDPVTAEELRPLMK